MERITDISKLVYTHTQGGQFRWVTVSTLMLALGAILHLVSPSVAGVTPNWAIATYCVAINLTKPTYKQALGIGLVSALINMMSSKSAFPYGNLVAEPLGALTCAVIVHLFGQLKVGKFSLKPIITGFFATIASGMAFVTILVYVLNLPMSVYTGAMIPLVVTVAVVNACITPIIFFPAQRLFKRRGFIENDDTITSNHSNYILEQTNAGLISIEHLTYYYTKAVNPSLKDINLSVQEGDFLAITGPAGCGKTTLCQAMVGAVPKFFGGRMEGMVFVDGKATTQMEIPELAEDVGVVLADYDSQLVTMTVAEEIAFAMENRGYSLDEIAKRSAIILKQVGLEGMEARKVASMSGGQRQRLAIGAVLATNPKILILDEPTSSLDPEGTEELYRFVGRLNKEDGITVIVIDHDLHAVLPYANRLALLVDGEIVSDGSVEETLRYMYNHNICIESLPTIFKAYMKLEAAGLELPTTWLSIESAKTGLVSLSV